MSPCVASPSCSRSKDPRCALRRSTDRSVDDLQPVCDRERVADDCLNVVDRPCSGLPGDERKEPRIHIVPFVPHRTCFESAPPQSMWSRPSEKPCTGDTNDGRAAQRDGDEMTSPDFVGFRRRVCRTEPARPAVIQPLAAVRGHDVRARWSLPRTWPEVTHVGVPSSHESPIQVCRGFQSRGARISNRLEPSWYRRIPQARRNPCAHCSVFWL
jgi:hypothetical protein